MLLLCSVIPSREQSWHEALFHLYPGLWHFGLSLPGEKRTGICLDSSRSLLRVHRMGRAFVHDSSRISFDENVCANDHGRTTICSTIHSCPPSAPPNHRPRTSLALSGKRLGISQRSSQSILQRGCSELCVAGVRRGDGR